jgi:hypothetical protein
MTQTKKRKTLVLEVLEELELMLLMLKILKQKYEKDIELLYPYLDNKDNSKGLNYLILHTIKLRNLKLNDIKIAILEFKQNVIYFERIKNK